MYSTIATSSTPIWGWRKPPCGAYKLNVNASIKGNDFVGVGFVLHDHCVKVYGTGVDKVMGNMNVDCAKVGVGYR